MKLKKIAVIVFSAIIMCFSFTLHIYADETQPFVDEEFELPYTIANNPISILYISDTTASCTSTTDGSDAFSISVTHTLQKYSGWLWVWENVSNASWSKTVCSSSICLSTTKSSLSSGTYRLKSVFTLTNSSGQTETITIYSSEQTLK